MSEDYGRMSFVPWSEKIDISDWIFTDGEFEGINFDKMIGKCATEALRNTFKDSPSEIRVEFGEALDSLKLMLGLGLGADAATLCYYECDLRSALMAGYEWNKGHRQVSEVSAQLRQLADELDALSADKATPQTQTATTSSETGSSS